MPQRLDLTIFVTHPCHYFIFGHLERPARDPLRQLPAVRTSDAANRAVERAKKEMFVARWKKVFEPDTITESIHMITRGQ